VPAFALFLLAERRARAAERAALIDTTILVRPAIGWALLGLLGSTATYFALLFTLAQYLQIGLGHSALFSGLILVPWVAAFGFADRARRHVPTRLVPKLPVAGFLLLAGVYLTIGVAALTGNLSTPLLAMLFVPGGLGLGTIYIAVLGHLAGAASREHAPDISGISNTTSQIAGSIGVAGFGALYLALAGSHSPAHAFGITVLALGATALLATIPAHAAIQTSISAPERIRTRRSVTIHRRAPRRFRERFPTHDSSYPSTTADDPLRTGRS
jgi:MFS family permease